MTNNKKVETSFILICDYAMVANDNKLSVMGVADAVKREKLPSRIRRLSFCATIKGKPNTFYEIDLKLHYQEEQEDIIEPTTLTVLTSPNGKHNIVVELTNVLLEKYGQYFFTIYNNETGDEIGRTTLDVYKPNKFN